MRTLILALGAIASSVPVGITLPAATVAAVVATTDDAQAQNRRDRKRNYSYREWRGRDGRTYCRRSDGTTGLVVGAVGGAVAGEVIAGGTSGPLIGALVGGLVGREIDRDKSRRRCR